MSNAQSPLHLVSYTVGWIPSSISITREDKELLAAERHVDPAMLRGQYRILGSRNDHALVSRGRRLRDSLALLREKYLLPETVVASTAAPDTTERVRTIQRARGSYVIPESAIPSFMTEFDQHRRLYLSWGVDLCDEAVYAELRDLDKAAIGESWELIAPKYPTQAVLYSMIHCTDPVFTPFQSTIDFTQLPPELAARLQESAAARLNATTAGISTLLTSQLLEFVEAASTACSRRLCISPTPDSAYRHLDKAEIVGTRRHAQSTSVPEGKIEVKVKSPDGETHTLVVDEVTYQETLRPYESSSYRRLAESTFDNLMNLTQKIANFRSQLQNDADSRLIDEFAEEIEATLRAQGSSATEIARKLRASDSLRDSLKGSFDDMLATVRESGLVERVQQSPLLRRIDFDDV